MSYLSNAMILEPDPTVRGAILEAITSVATTHLDRRTLDQTLETLVNGNRNLTQAAAKYDRSLRYRYPDRTGSVDRLQTISRAIVFLLGGGAQLRDFSGIYCPGCDFRGMQLAGAVFDSAVLSSAVFDNAVLNNSSFDNAVLTRTSFVGAHLNSAKFTLKRDEYPGFAVEEFRSKQGEPPYGPNFDCADLENADFSGQPLLVLCRRRQDSPTR
jgi:uncharacterized protein YjbI with pentapeptide repeats